MAAQDASADPAASAAAAGGNYTIGVSNTVAGNGWREEMICSIKAQALASGQVESLNIAHRNTDAAGQLEDIRNLIGAGVNAIVAATTVSNFATVVSLNPLSNVDRSWRLSRPPVACQP